MYKSVEINGKEYRFRITNKSQKEIEKRIGPLLEAISRATEAEILATIIWGALTPLNHGVTLESVDELIDKMVDEGIIDDADKRAAFVMELLRDAGFLSKAQLEKAQAAMTEKTAQ